jgi:hypothetical protein
MYHQERWEVNRKGDHDTYMTYATILDMHLANVLTLPGDAQNAILATLEEVLNDPKNASLVEGIAWDVVTMLLPFLGRQSSEAKANEVLTILVQKGNPKEVFLKCNEALKQIQWRDDDLDEYDDDESTIAETLKNVYRADEENKPVKQMTSMCGATDTGSVKLGRGVDVSVQANSDEPASAVSCQFCCCIASCYDRSLPIARGNRGPDDCALHCFGGFGVDGGGVGRKAGG